LGAVRKPRRIGKSRLLLCRFLSRRSTPFHGRQVVETDALRRLLKQSPFREVAIRFNVQMVGFPSPESLPQHLCGYCQSRKQNKRISRPPIEDTKQQEIRRLHAAGHSLRQVGRKVGVGHATADRYLKGSAGTTETIAASGPEWGLGEEATAGHRSASRRIPDSELPACHRDTTVMRSPMFGRLEGGEQIRQLFEIGRQAVDDSTKFC